MIELKEETSSDQMHISLPEAAESTTKVPRIGNELSPLLVDVFSLRLLISAVYIVMGRDDPLASRKLILCYSWGLMLVLT